MTLIVNTARMGYRGPDWLDVSRQGNEKRHAAGIKGGHHNIGLAFTPSNDLLRPYLTKRKKGLTTEADWQFYVSRYTVEMRTSYRGHREAWDKLLSWEHVVLLCFCKEPTHCHRRVLAGILAKLGARDDGELT